VTAVGATDNGGTATANGTNVLYTPVIASGTETFSYTISDGTTTASATVTVTVVAANTTPTAVNDSAYQVAENSTSNVLMVLANDVDPDAGDTLSIASVGAGSNGGTIVNNTTSVSYTPAVGFSGVETFTYTISDGTATSAAAAATWCSTYWVTTRIRMSVMC